MEKEMGRMPGIPAEPVQDQPLEPVSQKSSIIDFQKHPKVAGRIAHIDTKNIPGKKGPRVTQLEKPEEAVNEEQVLKKMKEAVTALGDLQLKTFDELSQFVGGNPKIQKALQDLREVRAQHRTPAMRSALEAVKGGMISAIIDGEGAGQLKRSQDIVPWEKGMEKGKDPYHANLLSLDRDKDIGTVMKKYIPLRIKLEAIKDADAYKEAWDVLSEKEQLAVMILQDIRQVRSDDEVLRLLFDASFRAAFKKRAENDRTGLTEKRRQVRMKAEEERLQNEKKRQEMVGDKYGLEIPGKGALRLELVDGKLWRVVESMGAKELQHEVNVAKNSGNTYLKDFSNAPQWLRDAAKEKGLI